MPKVLAIYTTMDYFGDRIARNVEAGNVKMIENLIDCGFLNKYDIVNKTTLFHIIAKHSIPNHKQMINMLLSKGFNINYKSDGQTPFEVAVINHNLSTAGYFLSKGCQYNSAEMAKYSVIMDCDVIFELQKELKHLGVVMVL